MVDGLTVAGVAIGLDVVWAALGEELAEGADCEECEQDRLGTGNAMAPKAPSLAAKGIFPPPAGFSSTMRSLSSITCRDKDNPN